MSDAPNIRNRIWLWPIVLLVCALMLSPAGGLIGAHGGSPVSASVSSAVTPLAAPLVPITTPLSHISTGIANLQSQVPTTSSGVNPITSSFSSLRSGESAPSGTAGFSTSTSPHQDLPTPAFLAPVAKSLADGQVPVSVAYLPSLSLLDHPVSTPSQAVSPLYTVAPAPMGIGDFGLGSSGPYSVYTPDVLGALTLNGYNATSGSTYEVTGAYYWDGLSPNANVTPWQSGIQLNTVVTNVSYPGSNVGQFWTQNVVDINGNSLQFIDNLWNFSAPSATLNTGTLYSYGGTLVPGEFYYAYGPTLPIAYPMTLDLYNNVSNVGGRTTVTFGYHVSEGATVYTGIYDTIVFNSLPTLVYPLLTPDYLVSGSSANPLGLLDDAELIFGGPGGGSNAMIDSLNGTASLAFREGSSWTPAESAYSYGTDTGETSIGIAGTWSGAAESLSQGPSMLYGLWNTSGGVPSGRYSVYSLPMSPSYAFEFVGLDGTNTTNLSWAPSEANGTVETYLPPGLTYNFTWFADGFAQANLTWTLSENVSILLTMIPDSGNWNAPLYMNGPAQAASLAFNTTGSVAAPYVFNNITVDVNLTFNHMNDWGFPDFDLLWANGVSAPIRVINVTQGQDSPTGNTYYQPDDLNPVVDLPGYGAQFAIWSGDNDYFANLTVSGYVTGTGVAIGGAVSLWNTTGAVAYNITSLDDSFGIWAAQSPGVVVADSFAIYGAVVLTVLNSPFAYGVALQTALGGLGVLDEGGMYGEFTSIDAEFESAGFYGIDANYTDLFDLYASDISEGAILDGCFSSYIEYVEATIESVGVEAEFSTDVTVVATSVVDNGFFTPGLEFFATSNTNVSNVFVAEDSFGVELTDVFGGTLSGVIAVNDSIGAEILDNFGLYNVTGVDANNSIGVVAAFGSGEVAISNVTATNGSVGAEAYETEDVFVQNVAAVGNAFLNTTVGFQVLGSDFVEIENVSANGLSIGVNVTASGYVAVFNTTASGVNAVGVYIDPSEYIYVYQTTATDNGVGIFVNDSTYIFVQDTTAFDGGAGVVAQDSSQVYVSVTNASDVALGVAFLNDTDSWVNTTNATDFSIGVLLVSSSQIHIYGVIAADTYVESPWYFLFEGEIPIAAVLTVGSYQCTVENMTTTEYPAALFDLHSDALAVQSVNASYGDFGLLLNGTFGSTFSGIGAFEDAIGVQLNAGAADNLITGSSFVDSTGYGVDIEDGTGNWVYLNNLIGNNGATGTYDAAHIQAFSDSSSNVFNSSSEVGNYWADWHSYTNGVLNPYTVSSGAWDYHPIGATAGMYAVTFYDSGLPSGTSWSVTLNGSTQTTVGSWISFDEFPGTYGFTVSAISGYSISPSSGAVVVATGAVSQTIDFAALYSVSFVESGLAPATSWSVWFNGVEQTGNGTTLSFVVVAGTYAYSVVNPADYAASPSSGSFSVSANYTVPVSFSSTLVTSYSVTVLETGLPSETTWSAIFNGVEKSTDTGSLTFTVPAGTYDYQILGVPGYTASPSAGTATVGAAYLVSVAFSSTTPPAPTTYTVWINETGLPSETSWSAIFNGVEETTSGTSLSFTVSAGSYSYQVLGVTGYAATPSSGTATVGGNYLVSVAFSSTTAPTPATYTVLINESGLPTGTTWSAVFDGVEKSTVGPSLSFTVPAGTYSYQISVVSGYTAAPITGSATVGGNYLVLVSFSSTSSSASTPSYVTQSNYNTGFEVALIVAVVALLIALVALLRRPKAAAPPPAAQWQEPAGPGEETPPSGPQQ
ncbi:MAG: thermopsin family protease [Thermoplasmata archaeon]